MKKLPLAYCIGIIRWLVFVLLPFVQSKRTLTLEIELVNPTWQWYHALKSDLSLIAEQKTPLSGKCRPHIRVQNCYITFTGRFCCSSSAADKLVLLNRSSGSPTFGALATQPNVPTFGSLAGQSSPSQRFGTTQTPQQQQSPFSSFGGASQ